MSPSDGTTTQGAEGARPHPVAAIDRTNGAVVVALRGELDLYNHDVVRDALLECCAEEPERLVVDLSEVEFIDSTALGTLVEARSRMQNRRAFILAAPGLEVRRTLEVAGFERHFSVLESRDEALRAQL